MSSPLPSLTSQGIKLAVFDMAGTTVNEGGLVYGVLKKVLKGHGLSFTEEEFDKFHGANKREVIAHFVHRAEPPSAARDANVDRLFSQFLEGINKAYFGEDSSVTPIEGVVGYFGQLRKAGIKVALNTGYPRQIADHLIAKLNFKEHIDGSLVAEEVGHGRPYPYMIHGLMKQFGVQKVSQVAKFGDTALDMQEGRNAGCGVVVGVLSGADDRTTLERNGASAVVSSVVAYPV